jgi:hypothetical protein
MRFIPVLLAFLFLSWSEAFPQAVVIHGTVKDSHSGEPVENANISVNGSDEGTFTDLKGQFSIRLHGFPASLRVSCIGYKPLYYTLEVMPDKSLELLLKSAVYELHEVDIKATRFSYVFRDRNYSILDYEIMDNRLLLLVFRYRLKHTELILLSAAGDTLAIEPVPELKPLTLYKDFLENVHYISSGGNAFLCRFDELRGTIDFPFKTTYDSLLRMVHSFLFKLGDRFYFEEYTPDGLGKNFGYFDSEGRKTYIQTLQNESARNMYRDDARFYNNWNETMARNQQALQPVVLPETKTPPLPRSSPLSMVPLVTEDDIHATALFHYDRINAPIVKVGENSLAVFNFSGKTIDFINPDGVMDHSVPLTLDITSDENLIAGFLGVFIHITDWKWSGKILIDEYFRDVYTTYTKNGMVQIQKIDLEKGTGVQKITIPFPFPKKIRIFQGNAYFLMKEIGMEYENWKLIRLNL